MTDTTTTATFGPARAALEAVAPEIVELEQLRARAVELAAEHRRQPPELPAGADRVDLQVSTARTAVGIIAAGGDPDREIARVAEDLARVDLQANAIWEMVARLLDDDIAELVRTTTDAQVEHLHGLLVDVVDHARAAAAEGRDLDELAARYSAIRRAHFVALRRTLDSSDPDRNAKAAQRLGWLRNLDAFEGQHRADVSGSWSGIPADPWRNDHASQFAFLVATPDAVPWAPAVAEIAAKAAELRAEVHEAIAERTGRPIVENRVHVTTRTADAEPESVLPAAMAARLGVENERRPVQRARQLR